MNELFFLITSMLKTDLRGAAWCLTQVAGTTSHFVNAREMFRHASALRLTQLWAQGVSVSLSRLRSFHGEVRAFNRMARRATEPIDGRLIDEVVQELQAEARASIVARSRYAAAATSLAPFARRRGWNDTGTFSSVCRAVVTARATAIGLRSPTDWEDLVRRSEHALTALVLHQREPIATTEGHHPLWDWTIERYPEPARVGSLGDALARARRWRLRWWVPAERAIAERLSELPRWAEAA